MRTERVGTKIGDLAGESAVCDLRRRNLLGGTVGRFRLIDLFAGAGGMTLGFTESFGQVFDPVWANDSNTFAADTYNSNFGNHCTNKDILDILGHKNAVPKADVVIGGPPCQGFSLLNKQRDGDPRKHLWQPYLEAVDDSGADVFVMENVPHLLGTSEHEQIIRRATSLGFKTTCAVLCAADYGVPQTRRRAFIVGSKSPDARPNLSSMRHAERHIIDIPLLSLGMLFRLCCVVSRSTNSACCPAYR